MVMSDAGKPNPRADSFSLYCNWVANRVLISLLQQNYLASKIHRTIRSKHITSNKAIANSPVPTLPTKVKKAKDNNFTMSVYGNDQSPILKLIKNQKYLEIAQQDEKQRKASKPRQLLPIVKKDSIKAAQNSITYAQTEPRPRILLESQMNQDKKA
jgi:hypothetical protein